jgi:LCP family protein required for cell wall assembly
MLSISTVLSITGNRPPVDEHGFTNILLIGQGDETGQDLTDSIILASIDATKTKSVVLLSFPRDLYFLHTEKMEEGRLNVLYRDYKNDLWLRRGMTEEDAALEAVKEVKDEIGRNLNMEVHHAIKVDFEAFVQAVDAVDGIDIDVPEDIEDLEYPDGKFGFDPFIVEAGKQHFDGETALKYARSRNTSSDFDRSARQQQLLGALGEKAKRKIDPATISRMMKILSDHVVTTMGVREMIGLFSAAKDIDSSRIVSMQLHDRNALYDAPIEPGGFLYAPPRNLFDGASVLLPVSIPEFPVTWKQLQTLKKLLFDMRSAHIADPTISMLNSGAPPGTARKLATELIRYGFDVDVIANASLEKQENAFVSGLRDSDQELAAFFATLIKADLKPMPESLPEAEKRTITVVLGQNFRYTPLQELIP